MNTFSLRSCFAKIGIAGIAATIGVLALASTRSIDAQAAKAGYHQTNLVSDQPGIATIQDPDLVNPWGISLNPNGGAFWVANNGTGKATLYLGDVNGSAFSKAALEVSIPGGLPTGTVFNSSNADFFVRAGNTVGAALFLFASQAGVISGWNPAVSDPPPPPSSTSAQVGATADAVYTGLAIAQVGSARFLYAADFEHGKIDVYNTTFQLVQLDGSFTDPDLLSNYSPFNIQTLNGKLYVTYAQQSHKAPGEETGHGTGIVNVFDTSGHLETRFVLGHSLQAPWALAIAPADFGPFSGALLVGNFGSGRIAAFDPDSGTLLGELHDEKGKPIVIDGLWALVVGNGVSAGDSNAVYFAAGIDNEAHGLFGSLRFVGGS